MEVGDQGGLTARGIGWKGEGELKGKWGQYKWEIMDTLEDGTKRQERTDIYLDETGILYGRVKGTGLDWAYWAMPATKPIRKVGN